MQQPCYLVGGELVNPITCAVSACIYAHLGEILRRNLHLRGIPPHLSLRLEGYLLKHGDESLEELAASVAVGLLEHSLSMCPDIEDIHEESLHTAKEYLAVVDMVCLPEAVPSWLHRRRYTD